MTASIQVTPELVGPAARLLVLVIDSLADKNPSVRESVSVDVSTSIDDEPTRVTKIDHLLLTETGKNTGVFAGSIQLTPDKNKIPGTLEVLPGDLVSIMYETIERKKGKLTPVMISEVAEIMGWDPEFVVDKDQYRVGDSITVTISDPGANLDPEKRDSIRLQVYSRKDSEGISINAVETGKDVGVFRATFLLSKAKSTGSSIQVLAQDEVTIAYSSQFPADYVDEIKKSGRPDKAFYFSVPVGYVAPEPIEALDHVQKYFDPIIFNRIRNGEFLPSTNNAITIAFWDIRNFSKMVDSLRADPKMAVRFLNEYFELATDVIGRNGGILDKFIGDGVMALFGVFDDQKKNPEKGAIAAVNTALDFRKRFLELLKKWQPKWNANEERLIEIELGCGINTGAAFVGTVGGEMRKQFTAIGRAVNIASRIESNSEGNKILISTKTLEKVKGHFVTKHFGDLELKKLDGKYPCYEVISKASYNE
jgi:class 3 adenylate cyclase